MKTFTFLLIPFIVVFIFVNYKKERETGQLLTISLNNPIYNKFDSLTFDSVFIHELNILLNKGNDINEFELKKHYIVNGYKPNIVIKFFRDGSLDSLVKYINSSNEHGINPKIFHYKEIAELIAKLKIGDFKTVNESYPLIARLEILCADALTRYTSYLKFGLVNPKEIFLRYYINVKQADSLFVPNLLNSANILDTLRSIQYKSEQYKALQYTFLTTKNDSLKKILTVNMERLRWVMPNVSEKYIQVNIPEFKLVYFNGKDTLTSMKVCVGERRNLDYDKRLKIYEKTGEIEDKPENHETPILISNIKKLYTNPVWNIPESIVQTEIFSMASRNSNYLRRKNIAVYYKNKRIENPSGIRWYKYDRDKIPFLFVQQPGSDNSLGRLKFMFPNSSSVYLHDTNFKSGFRLANRAISHGCIRLEKPLRLAQLLMADTIKFDEIRKELNLDPLYRPITKTVLTKKPLNKKEVELVPTLFFPKEETPLIITYFTAWSHNNKIEYRPDVYAMDDKLWLAMKKFR